MPNWFKKSQNWYNKNRQKPESRYSFSVYGDIFVEEQENKEQEKEEVQQKFVQLINEVAGVRVNSQNAEPYQRVI